MSSKSGNRRFEVCCVANITAPDGSKPVFYEVHEIFTIEGEERRHRNADLSFSTRKEAEDWICKQD